MIQKVSDRAGGQLSRIVLSTTSARKAGTPGAVPRLWHGGIVMSRVLLADDDIAFRDALLTLLVDAGHTVTTAGNGLEAISAALSARPDMIVSDIHMPVLEGPDAVSMLRAIPRFSGTLVILMSGEAASEGIPAADFFRKPFDPGVLLDRLDHLAARENPALETASLPPVVREVARVENDARPDYVFRAFTLVMEQERRVSLLQRRGEDTALAADVYDAFLNTVSALTYFLQANADMNANMERVEFRRSRR